jgi:hypothetical protein
MPDCAILHSADPDRAGKMRLGRLADSVPPLFQAKTFWEVQAFISR